MSVEVVYSCLICGKAFSKRASLAAHMKVHRDVKMAQLNVDLPEDLRDAFNEVCHKHHTTTCHVIYTLIKAFIEGEKRGLVDLGTHNPVTIQVVNLFGARPRGHGKYDVAAATPFAGSNPPVLCLYMDGVDGDQVFCQKRGGLWLPLSVCSTCPKNRFQKKGEV
jgi:hypothetical protein